MTVNSLISTDPVAPRLGLWDTASIIIGIVVGTTIFRGTAMIFDAAGGPWSAMALWMIGGGLVWCGAVCYAELATTYPHDGGDYQYLNHAFGSWCGFLFAWAQISCIISGNIAIMAYAFADYALRVRSFGGVSALWLTLTPIIGLSAMNGLGIVAGKVTQNILTTTKIIGLVAIMALGFFIDAGPQATTTTETNANLGLGLVFVLYAFGGWVHAAYVAAEVRDQQRNLPRALSLGIVGILIIYLTINASYLHALGYDAARVAQTPAADVLERTLGTAGERAISVLVMLSALGAINGMILTGTRIYAVWGADYPALAWLAAWNTRRTVPLPAIVLQAVIACLLVVLVGTETGRNGFDAALNYIGLDELPWNSYQGGFNTLIAGSAPVFWLLCLFTGIAFFVLRARHPNRPRPFSVPGYPLPPILFCLTCAFMLYSSLAYAGWLSLMGIVPLMLGAGVWSVMRRGPSK